MNGLKDYFNQVVPYHPITINWSSYDCIASVITCDGCKLPGNKIIITFTIGTYKFEYTHYTQCGGECNGCIRIAYMTIFNTILEKSIEESSIEDGIVVYKQPVKHKPAVFARYSNGPNMASILTNGEQLFNEFLTQYTVNVNGITINPHEFLNKIMKIQVNGTVCLFIPGDTEYVFKPTA